MGFEFQKLLFSSSFVGLWPAKSKASFDRAADEYHQEYPVTTLLLLQLLLFYLFDDRYFSSQKNWSLCVYFYPSVLTRCLFL